MPDSILDKAPLRREDDRFLTGRGRYTGDLHPPGLAHAVVVRAPQASGRLTGIDLEAARGAPGVLGVFTAADLAADGISGLVSGIELKRPDGSKAPVTVRPVLVADRVRYPGEPVALVVATSVAAARDAADLVAVDIEETPAVATITDALAAGAPVLWDEAPDNVGFIWTGGDEAAVNAAFSGAHHVTRLKSRITRVTAAPLEPRGAMGAIDDDGRLVLHASLQSIYGFRTQLAQAVFKIAPEQVRIVAGDVGGSFGMKSALCPEDVLTMWAARKLGRPVHWVEERTEAFLSDEHARDIDVVAELALDADGHFVGLRVGLDVNIGSYLTGRSLAPIQNIGGIAGVYRTPAILATVRGVFSNTSSTGPYRGAGRPEATYIIERIIDVAAREIGVDPAELRRRNLIAPDAMPYKTALTFTYDCGEFAANMDAAVRLADVAGFAARKAASKARGRLRGLGWCNPIEVAGGPFSKPAKDNTRLTLDADGGATLRVGAVSVGQGLETVFPQLVADRLGIPAHLVRYMQGDTDNLAAGRGSGGSSAAAVSGSVVFHAIEQVLEKAKQLASEHLEAAEADIEFSGGVFSVAGTDRRVGIAEIARISQDPTKLPSGLALGLSELAEFQPTAVTFPNGSHICEVEVDPQTGVVTIERYSAVEDVGRILNHALVLGQIHGGIAQGIGQVLGEEIVYDASTGQLLSGSFMDYQMPRASDLPSFHVETRSVPTAVNPLGTKGVGEAGTVGAIAATVNAICDALAEAGVRHIDMPTTPSRVWAALQAAKAT